MKQGRGNHTKSPSPGVACASCGARAALVILPAGQIGGVTLPPFPVCRHCDGVYRSCPDKRAQDRFLLEMAQETLRRLKERC